MQTLAFLFLLLPAIWVGLVMVLTVIPSLQSHLVYLNLLSSLVTPDVYYPHRFGLSKDASQTFELPTRDGETIGGWKLQSYTRRADPERLLLFFHGNGGSRALKQRLEVYHELRQHGDVWTIDYRGFADSSTVVLGRGNHGN